jgi:type IV secretory pathway VirB4 component
MATGSSKKDEKMKDTVKARKPLSEKSSTQRFLPIAEVRDNTVVLKNGGLRAVLQTSSVNFHLKSEEEQNALVVGYQSFLNGLEFPVQVLVRSKKLDIDKYLDSLEELADQQANPLLEKQTREYHSYIEKLVEYTDIMEKRFYVVVPMDAPTGTKVGFIDRLLSHLRPDDSVSKLRTRRKMFKDLRKKLTQRASSVTQGLANCNLRVKELNTAELIELYYHSYNPITAKEEKVQDLSKTNINTL